MQCGNCRFENMPGSRNCARCGSLMDLGGEAIDVHPPRARRWVKPARGLTRPRFEVARRVNEALNSLRPPFLRGVFNPSWLTLDMLIRALIPGWLQFYLRRRVRGWVFLVGSIIGAIVAIVFVGTTRGNLAFAFLFSMHAGSISDAFTPPGRTLRENIFSGLLVYAALACLLYFPATWLVGRVNSVYSVQEPISQFAAGDVLQVRHIFYPHRGQLVLFQQQEQRIQAGNHRYLRIVGGPAIERVIALPGDHVRSSDGVLIVNDEAVYYRPLNPAKLPNFDLTVPPGRCLIWPMVLGGIGDAWEQVAFIEMSTISGAVYFRSFPWSRFGFIQ